MTVIICKIQLKSHSLCRTNQKRFNNDIHNISRDNRALKTVRQLNLQRASNYISWTLMNEIL